jgi:hypothetical protein
MLQTEVIGAYSLTTALGRVAHSRRLMPRVAPCRAESPLTQPSKVSTFINLDTIAAIALLFCRSGHASATRAFEPVQSDMPVGSASCAPLEVVTVSANRLSEGSRICSHDLCLLSQGGYRQISGMWV